MRQLKVAVHSWSCHLYFALTIARWRLGPVPRTEWLRIGRYQGSAREVRTAENVVWRTPLPAGHSSPVLTQDRIFLTGYDEQNMLVFCLDRSSGKILWRREIARPRKEELHKANSPASPSPVTDGKNLYVFFTDYGLMSFRSGGKERWRTAAWVLSTTLSAWELRPFWLKTKCCRFATQKVDRSLWLWIRTTAN